MTLPPEFLTQPLAHRGLHDLARGRPENSRAAIRAAIDRGYGIEIDLQCSSDGQAMVFHDYDLDRLTGATGPLAARSAADLARITLADGDAIPTLAQVLTEVAGRVPLLIEIKGQEDGAGPDTGALERATAQALAGYEGPLAVMSFDPKAVARMADLAPRVPRGLTTCGFTEADCPELSAEARDLLRDIAHFDRVGASFISHDATDLASARVAELKGKGIPVLCWTICSPEQEEAARRVADNITFEGYLP